MNFIVCRQFDDNNLITLKSILNRLEPKVHATEHLKIVRNQSFAVQIYVIDNTVGNNLKISLQLKRIEKYFTSQETNKYEDIVNTIQRIKIIGIKRVKENNKMSDNLKPIFYEILNIESPKMPDKQNQAFIQFPSIFLCFICISIINYFSSVL